MAFWSAGADEPETSCHQRFAVLHFGVRSKTVLISLITPNTYKVIRRELGGSSPQTMYSRIYDTRQSVWCERILYSGSHEAAILPADIITSLTPSPVCEEHSRYSTAPTALAAASPCSREMMSCATACILVSDLQPTSRIGAFELEEKWRISGSQRWVTL